MISDYNQAVELLTSQGKFYINLGLDRMQNVLKLLSSPEKNLKIIHVAGTNGKGSVCSVLANILKCAGYKIGLYTSPHLKDYTERIQINGEQITKNDFAKYTALICELAEANKIDLTEFEILTACAYKYFADNNVDFAIMETGLGGRFDATNAIDEDFFSIITSISLDHTDRLGSTIEEIAAEKAGIIKKNSVVIVSLQNNGYKVICQTAKAVNANVLAVQKDIETVYENGINYAVIGGKRYEFPLLGRYQRQNLALVLKSVEFIKSKGYEIAGTALSNGLKTAKWAARLEYNKEKNMIIDGAHNPDAAKELKLSLDFYFKDKKKIFIYSTINTKDYKKIAEILFNHDDEIYYYEFEHKNAVSFKNYTKDVNWLKNIHLADKKQMQTVLNRHELKVLTGSLYMIGDFLKNN